MEIWMMGMLAAVWLGVSAQTVLLAMALRRGEPDREKPAAQETEEEKELRRLAAESQRQFEQGFVNLMRYDGSPGRKERDRL